MLARQRRRRGSHQYRVKKAWLQMLLLVYAAVAVLCRSRSAAGAQRPSPWC
jgi:hypothetical protein